MFRIFLILMLFFVFSGCRKSEKVSDGSTLTVVASNYAVFDFARIIGGEGVSVELLLPPGVESHSYEPTPRDMVRVGKSALFVCIDRSVEPWVDALLSGASLGDSRIVESGKGIDFLSGSCGDDHGHAHSGCDHSQDKKAAAKESNDGFDPHIWLDPIRAKQMTDNIADAFIAEDSIGKAGYRYRADSLAAELQALHERFVKTFEKVETKTIMYAGHFAFGYFADRYGLDHISPYSGFSPNAEPTPTKIVALIKRIREEKITTVFYEELVEPRVARTVVDETGVEMVLLHGIHNVSSYELQDDFSYLKGMEENRLKLEKGLNRK